MTVPSPYAAALDRIPVRRGTFEALGSSTAYWEYGKARPDGETIVLVHGFRGDHHGLEPVVAALPGAHIVSPDLPGFGDSTPMSGASHDIDGYGRWLREFVANAPISGRFVLLGHSFGSIIVAAATVGGDWAQGRRPDDIVLVNPIGAPALSGPRAVFTRLAVFYYWLAAALPERLGFGLLRNPLIVRIMSIAMAKTRNAALRRWIHDQHSRYFSAFSNRDVVLEAFRASVSHDVSEYASRIAQPTLLIAADKDDITPIAAEHRLRGLFPSARLNVVHDVGHLIHYEAPQEAALAIRSFLAQVEPAEGEPA
jgi:pimeloyl-ACP methyl ester carboxylesterase